MQDGEPHLKQRRLLNPPFQGQAVLSYRERIQETAEAEVRKWPRGTPIAIRPRMEAITVETILHAVIGVSDPQRVERVRELLREMSAFRIPDMWAAWIFPKILDSPIGRRNPVMRARAEMVRLIKEEIAATRANPNGRNDILALLAATRDEDGALFDEEQVVDQVISLIFAGHDTTTTTLAWACERLVRHPAALARLHESLDAGEEDYLDAVVKETLRVRPTLYAVWRKLTAPAVVAGHRLPADTLVYGALPLVHSSAAFPDPDEFRPERFLDGQPPPYSWIPFGGGPHRCMGAAFALMETKAVLTTVLRNVELRPPPNQRPEGRRVNNVTLRPARGGRVVVTARSVRSARSSAREPVGAAEAPTPECPVHADASTTTRAEQPA